jgi:hypothetical protein
MMLRRILFVFMSTLVVSSTAVLPSQAWDYSPCYLGTRDCVPYVVGRVRVMEGHLNLRYSPDGMIKGLLYRGDRVYVMAAHGTWFYVDSPAGSGWVHRDFIVFE